MGTRFLLLKLVRIILQPQPCFAPGEGAHLLMVLNAHAQSVDKDGSHNAPVEVLAVYDATQLATEGSPEAA